MKNIKNIYLIGSTGAATTEIDAFDSALLGCGIGNYNLVRLSSVIPPYSKVTAIDLLPEDYGVWGDKLYVVYAFGATTTEGQEVWAGVGWVILEDNGAGLFVEHHASSEEECKELIEQSLVEMCRNRGLNLDDYVHDLYVIGAKCDSKNKAVSALVAAVYEAEGWKY